MLKLMHKLNRFYIKFNKVLLFLPLFSIFSIFSDNKIFKSINNIIKLLIIINIVLGVSVVLYFTDFVTPLNQTFSIYQDLLEPYIEVIKHLWNKLITYFNNFINSVAQPDSDSLSSIKNEVKTGMKEAITEALNELEADNTQYNLIKNIGLTSALLFMGYFIFFLPGTSITPDELTNFNWFNQSLIEIKIHIINYFNKPGNPPNPGNQLPNIPDSPISPVSEISTYFPNPKSTVDVGVSPIDNSHLSPLTMAPISPLSDSTIIPNTITPNSPIQTLSEFTDAQSQTYIDGLSVSKMVETVNILKDTLDPESADIIKDGVNKIIKNITD